MWLAYWHIGRAHFDFVTAERVEGESVRESLDREIAWLLDLRRGKDYIISSMARLNLHLPKEAPDDEADGVVEFYVVDLYGKSGPASVELSNQLRWLTGEEVLSGRTTDGEAINPCLVELLARADVMTRHT